MPEVLITDRGMAFTADLTNVILKHSQKSHRRTTAYHPQMNSLTEHLNKTLVDMLARYVNVKHKTWDAVLLHVTFTYNMAVQEMQITRFKLLYGRNLTTTLNTMQLHVTDKKNLDVSTYLAARQRSTTTHPPVHQEPAKDRQPTLQSSMRLCGIPAR